MAIDKQKQAAKRFSEYWKDKGYEKGQSQQYWNMLLRTVLGVESPETFIEYEDRVLMDKTTGFIDGYIPSTKVLIEQKSITKDLNKGILQSDGQYLSPFQQAKRYIVDLPVSKHPKWVITCNFREMYIYDMENPRGEPEIIKLSDLEKDYYRLSFIVDSEKEHLKKEMELSVKAGDIVGLIYDAFSKQYRDINNKHSIESLNKLCVRLVFCLYAEDAGLFKTKNHFHDYLSKFSSSTLRQALIDLFKILDTKEDERDPYLDEDLLSFPYVNGGLFSDENIEIPRITDEIKELLLTKASDDFDWSEISPTIFGAVFESTLNPETRRSGGMHYTSIENIHKVIDPLFLNDLKEELEEIKQLKQKNQIDRRVKEFQNELSSLTFLDPAAGSGNFLTETFLSLRKLENEALLLSNKGQSVQMVFGDDLKDLIKVHINQFYGIEINDFAVSVAQTALWIAEHQMMRKTEELFYVNLDFLPLKSYMNIIEENALTYDWNNLVPSYRLNYIMGNPPFIGYFMQSKEQKEEILNLFVDENGKQYKNSGKIDYVSGWYLKSLQMMKRNSNIKAALVSTNSIVQGTMASALWEPLRNDYNININFAYRSFPWESESKQKATVHCVIIGFSNQYDDNKTLYLESGNAKKVKNINQYLVDFPFVFIQPRTNPLCKVPVMSSGGKPVEGGNLIFTEKEYKEFIEMEPKSKKYMKKFMGPDDFLHNKTRYCLWLLNCSPAELREMPYVLERVEAVKEFRLSSKKTATQNAAQYPTRFVEIKNTSSHFVVVPEVSSEKRRYIPMAYLDDSTILSNGLRFIPKAGLYEFGILESNVHMAWTRQVCGRLEMRYDYSVNIVYNNFPWPKIDDKQKNKIENTAKNILVARRMYSDSTLSDLYDEVLMPIELRKAHQENDKAVMEAYGFTKVIDGKRTWLTETETVEELMKMYKKLNSK